tara:strand:+ start:808 stop:918 length:111 start_codon:yes stop_codon:yes gene_type:complete
MIETMLGQMATTLFILVLFSFGFVMGYAARKSEEEP